MVKAELRAAKLWRDEYEEEERGWFEKTVELIRQRFFTLKDFSEQGRAYFSDDFDFDEAAIEEESLQRAAAAESCCLSWPADSKRSSRGRWKT